MSLRNLKRRLAIDQRNLLIGTVVEARQGTVRVRMHTGEVRTAATSEVYALGARVQVQTNGSTATVTGPAQLAELGGVVVYTV